MKMKGGGGIVRLGFIRTLYMCNFDPLIKSINYSNQFNAFSAKSLFQIKWSLIRPDGSKQPKKFLVEFIAAQQAFSFHGKLISGGFEVTPKNKTSESSYIISIWLGRAGREWCQPGLCCVNYWSTAPGLIHLLWLKMHAAVLRNIKG